MNEKRMVSAEQKAYIDLLGAISRLAYIEDGMGRRLKSIPRAMFRLKGATSNLMSLSADILGGLRVITGISAQMPRDADGTFGRWLSFKDLDVVATAIRECCRTCTTEDPQEQKKCMFCKLLDILPTEKPDEGARGCGYFTIW